MTETFCVFEEWLDGRELFSDKGQTDIYIDLIGQWKVSYLHKIYLFLSLYNFFVADVENTVATNKPPPLSCLSDRGSSSGVKNHFLPVLGAVLSGNFNNTNEVEESLKSGIPFLLLNIEHCLGLFYQNNSTTQ